MKPTNNTYEIRTLRDIYNLPTIEQVEVCAKELTEFLLMTRKMNDVLNEMAKVAGITIPDGRQAVEFPEVAKWIDDGKGSLTAKFVSEDKQEPILTVETTVNNL